MTKHLFRPSIRYSKPVQFLLGTIMLICCSNITRAQKPATMVRISEIEIYPQYLAQYKTILQREAEASIKLEPGVIAIFPMFQKENPPEVRILEIYQDKDAYQSHLKTRHFFEYKNGTIQMVKSLKLVDVDALDLDTAAKIFRKFKN